MSLATLASGYSPLPFRRRTTPHSVPAGLRKLAGASGSGWHELAPQWNPPSQPRRSRVSRPESGWSSQRNAPPNIGISGQYPVHGTEDLLRRDLAGKAASGVRNRIVVQSLEQLRYAGNYGQVVVGRQQKGANNPGPG